MTLFVALAACAGTDSKESGPSDGGADTADGGLGDADPANPADAPPPHLDGAGDAQAPALDARARRAFLFAGAGPTLFKIEADWAARSLRLLDQIPAGDDVRLVELAPDQRRAYVQTEVGQAQAVLAFDIDSGAELRPIGELRLPYPLVQGVTQISMHPRAPWFVLSATNESPGLEDQLMPVGADGRLGPHRSISQLFYAFAWDPAGRFFYGLDGEEIFQYIFDAEAGTITPNDPTRAEGSAGRTMLALRNHPNGRWVYSVEEGALGLFTLDADRGPLRAQGFVENPIPTEAIYWTSIAVHPSGRFLYALGYLSPAKVALVDVFSVDAQTGALAFVARQKGDPSRQVLNHGLQGPLIVEDLLVVGGASTDLSHIDRPALLLYHIDPATGALTPAAPLLPLPGPPGGVSFLFAVEQGS